MPGIGSYCTNVHWLTLLSWLRICLLMQRAWVQSLVRELRSDVPRSNSAHAQQLKKPACCSEDPVQWKKKKKKKQMTKMNEQWQNKWTCIYLPHRVAMRIEGFDKHLRTLTNFTNHHSTVRYYLEIITWKCTQMWILFKILCDWKSVENVAYILSS